MDWMIAEVAGRLYWNAEVPATVSDPTNLIAGSSSQPGDVGPKAIQTKIPVPT